jgi:hypothetical protein
METEPLPSRPAQVIQPPPAQVIPNRFENMPTKILTEANRAGLPYNECSICQLNFNIGDRLSGGTC